MLSFKRRKAIRNATAEIIEVIAGALAVEAELSVSRSRQRTASAHARRAADEALGALTSSRAHATELAVQAFDEAGLNPTGMRVMTRIKPQRQIVTRQAIYVVGPSTELDVEHVVTAAAGNMVASMTVTETHRRRTTMTAGAETPTEFNLNDMGHANTWPANASKTSAIIERHKLKATMRRDLLAAATKQLHAENRKITVQTPTFTATVEPDPDTSYDVEAIQLIGVGDKRITVGQNEAVLHTCTANGTRVLGLSLEAVHALVAAGAEITPTA